MELEKYTPEDIIGLLRENVDSVILIDSSATGSVLKWLLLHHYFDILP